MPDRAYLHPIDPDLLPGAHNAIDVCLQLKPQERITIITDTVTRGIAAALQSEVEHVGSKYSLFVLEHHARRPLSHMPEPILQDLALSQVSIFAAQTQPGELGARGEMTSVVNRYRIRHAHMVNINRQITGNTVPGDGFGFGFGGGIYNPNGTLNITGSTIANPHTRRSQVVKTGVKSCSATLMKR